MPIPENTLVPDPADQSAGRVMGLVAEGYRLLAEIHAAVGQGTYDPSEARRHVTNATRELAAIEEIYDRRGKDR